MNAGYILYYFLIVFNCIINLDVIAINEYGSMKEYGIEICSICFNDHFNEHFFAF